MTGSWRRVSASKECPSPPSPRSANCAMARKPALFLAFMGLFRLIGRGCRVGAGRLHRPQHFRAHARDPTGAGKSRRAFPEKTNAEIDAILRGMWDNLGPHRRGICPSRQIRSLRRRSAHRESRMSISRKTLRGKSALLVSGHFANWEIMPIAASCFGLDGAIVYRPPNNPYVDRYIAQARAKKGYADQISKHTGPSASSRCCAAARRSFCWPTRRPMKGLPRPSSAATP